MADSTFTKLMQLLSAPEEPVLRRAAVLVSGSLGTAQSAALVKALLANLQENDVELRLASIDALGRLRADAALPSLEGFARQGGAELEAAVQAAGQLGARGIKAMSKIMEETTPALRSRMAAVLARSGTGGGLVATAHALLDADPKVVDAAARSLTGEVPSFSPSQKQALAKFLGESLRTPKRGSKKDLATNTEAAMLRVLGALHDAKATDLFWARLGPEEAPEVRAAALYALGQYTGPINDVRLKRLVVCAADIDFQIVAPALMILKKIPASAKNAQLWLKLLDSPDVATRRFAVEKLGDLESAEVARSLLDQLTHVDRDLRIEARQALLRFGKGRQALFDHLLEAQSVEVCWDLARGLIPAAKELPKSLRPRLLERAGRYHDQDDRRAAALWYFLREMDPDWAHEQIENRALALRKRKKYTEALGYYRLLAQDPGCCEDSRFELAATGLKVSTHETAAEARRADHALIQFGRLLENPSFDLIGRVNKAKWLEVADLFYLGFHFVEQTHGAREFGKEVLELVAKRSPKSDIGKNARKKLRSAGFG